MKKTILAAILPALLIFSAIASAQTSEAVKISEVKPVASVDLKQYTGKWYEIARYEDNSRKSCVGNTTISYALKQDDEIEITNECINKDGITDTLKTNARIADKTTNAKLEIKMKKSGFFSAFSSKWKDYWILDIGSNYNYAVIGDPKREDFHILSRQPEMNAATYQRILRFAETIGYNPGKIYKTPQNVEAIKGEVVEKP